MGTDEDYDGHGGGEHPAAGDHDAARAAGLLFLVDLPPAALHAIRMARRPRP